MMRVRVRVVVTTAVQEAEAWPAVPSPDPNNRAPALSFLCDFVPLLTGLLYFHYVLLFPSPAKGQGKVFRLVKTWPLSGEIISCP